MKPLFILLFSSCIFGIAYSAENDFSYYTCAEDVEIYASPDGSSEIFTTLPYGTEIKPVGANITTKDGWTFAKIRVNERDGYINDHHYFRLTKGQILDPLILKLPLKNGKTLEFKNNYCEGEQHSVTSLISHEKTLEFYLVRTVVYEGGEKSLIDENTGAKYRIYGGNLIFSPNKKKFLTSSYDVYGDAYFLAIYTLSRRKPVLKFEKRAFTSDGITWDPNTVKWLSNDTVEYIIKSKTGLTPKQIKFNGKKWIEQK